MSGEIFAGIDSGLTAVGAVVVDVEANPMRVVGMRCIQTHPSHRQHHIFQVDDDTRRCQEIARGIRELHRSIPFRGAVVELPTGGARGSRANRAMGLAHGVIIGTLEGLGVPVQGVLPDAVKTAAGGKRLATKDQVQRGILKAFDWSAVEASFGYLRPLNRWEHIADAAGTVLAARGWAQSPFRALDARSPSSVVEAATPSGVNHGRGAEDRAGGTPPARQRRSRA